MIEEVQPCLAQLDLDDWAESSRELDLVEKARKELQFDPLTLAEIGHHMGKAIALAEFAVQRFDMRL